MATNKVLEEIQNKFTKKVLETLEDLDALEDRMDIDLLIFTGIFSGFAKINFVRGIYYLEPVNSIYINGRILNPSLSERGQEYLSKHGKTIYKKLPRAIEVKIKKDRKEEEKKINEEKRKEMEEKKMHCDIRKGLKEVAENIGDD